MEYKKEYGMDELVREIKEAILDQEVSVAEFARTKASLIGLTEKAVVDFCAKSTTSYPTAKALYKHLFNKELGRTVLITKHVIYGIN